MLHMNLQVSVRYQKQSGEGMLHGRDICWELLALLPCFMVQLSRVVDPGRSPELLLLPPAGEGVSLWLMENSAHPCPAMATQQEPEIFRLYAGILMETFASKLTAMLLYPAA